MPLSIDKLVLGTAQFKADYGIANKVGQPSPREILQILSLAWERGIRQYDTAPAYGSENFLGEFITAHGIKNEIKVLTKIPTINFGRDYQKEIYASLENSINCLGCAIDVLFFHSAGDGTLLLENPEFFETLLVEHPVSSMGVSVYDPSEMIKLKNRSMELAIQFPFSVMDDRFGKLKLEPGKRYARSIFLQGLLTSKTYLKPTAPQELADFHSGYHRVLKEHGVDPIDFALTFVYTRNAADFFLVGVETVEQVSRITGASLLETEQVSMTVDNLPELKSEFLDPRNWGTTFDSVR